MTRGLDLKHILYSRPLSVSAEHAVVHGGGRICSNL